MKRVTIALDEELYVSLVDYAANKSEREMRRFSVGEAIRDLLALQLASLGYTRQRPLPILQRRGDGDAQKK